MDKMLNFPKCLRSYLFNLRPGKIFHWHTLFFGLSTLGFLTARQAARAWTHRAIDLQIAASLNKFLSANHHWKTENYHNYHHAQTAIFIYKIKHTNCNFYLQESNTHLFLIHIIITKIRDTHLPLVKGRLTMTFHYKLQRGRRRAA